MTVLSQCAIVDPFTRTVASGWGGSWYLNGGTASYASVDGAFAHYLDPAAVDGVSIWRYATQPPNDVRISIDVQWETISAVAGDQQGYFLLNRVLAESDPFLEDPNTGYAAYVSPNGPGYLAQKLTIWNGTLTSIFAEVDLPPITAGVWYTLHLEATGVSPTTLVAYFTLQDGTILGQTDPVTNNNVLRQHYGMVYVGSEFQGGAGGTARSIPAYFDNLRFCGLCIRDTWTRTEASGWGTADSGQTWTVYDEAGISATARSTVADGIGRLIITEGLATNADDVFAELDVLLLDMPFQVDVQMPVMAASATENPIAFVVLRQDPTVTTEYGYEVGFRLNSNGMVAYLSLDRIGPATGMFVGDTVTLPTPAQYGAWWTIRGEISGETPTIQLKAWPKGTTPPAAWQIDYTDTDANAITTPGRFRLGAHETTFLAPSDYPVEWWFDNLGIDCPLLTRLPFIWAF